MRLTFEQSDEFNKLLKRVSKLADMPLEKLAAIVNKQLPSNLKGVKRGELIRRIIVWEYPIESVEDDEDE